MLWFVVWTVLVLASLAGAFLVFRRLYRSAKALLAELGRASDLLAELDRRTAELTDRARAAHPVTPVELADPEPARRRRAATRAAADRRRARRLARREETFGRWAALSR